MYNSSLNLGARWWGGGSKPRPGRFTPGKDLVPIVYVGEGAPGPVWTGAENLASTGIRFPDRPVRSCSLYRLSYPDPQIHDVVSPQIRIFACKFVRDYWLAGQLLNGARIVQSVRRLGYGLYDPGLESRQGQKDLYLQTVQNHSGARSVSHSVSLGGEVSGARG
jgi:hypothetical protein